MSDPTAPAAQEAVTGWIIIGTTLCFAFALACIASDHLLPRLSAWWRNRRWTNYEHRCGYGDCELMENHKGDHHEVVRD